MTDKEFRRLSRSDLIEIIYRLQQNVEQYKTEIESLKAHLEGHDIKMSKVGSIAEATVALHDLFETAQATANDYLARVEELHRQARQELEDAERQRDRILTEAQRQAEMLLADAWQQYERKQTER